MPEGNHMHNTREVYVGFQKQNAALRMCNNSADISALRMCARVCRMDPSVITAGRRMLQMIQGKREVWIGKPESKQIEGNKGYGGLGCNTHNHRTAPLRPMRDACESAPSVEVRSRTDIVRVSS